VATKKSLLVVEDDLDIQMLLKFFFEEEGFTFFYASNGQEALDQLHAMPDVPDLILLDLRMPVMDGFQFLQEQEKDVKISQIPIVVMTADGKIHTKKGELDRAKDVLKKPLDLDNLLATVKKNCAKTDLQEKQEIPQKDEAHSTV
jgi:DNA-binding response OmpR family regulator